MRGELVYVWEETWPAIWEPLYDLSASPDDMFCELFRELSAALRAPLSPEELADVIDNPRQSMEAFRSIKSTDFLAEKAAARFCETAYTVLQEFDVEDLENQYFDLLDRFVSKYSLRYELGRPCVLYPTVAGVFASLVRELRSSCQDDAHVVGLLDDLEDSFRDLHGTPSQSRLKTVIQKQFNLLEALGRTCSGVTHSQLGAMCAQVSTWPHPALGVSLSKLYGFASDYPGIRHSGNPAGQIRDVDMRDVVALVVVLTGFTPYLRDHFDISRVFHGS